MCTFSDLFAFSCPWEELLIWLLSKQGHYQATTHFKDTWKGVCVISVALHNHKPFWCRITLNSKSINTSAGGEKNRFFISAQGNASQVPGKVVRATMQNKMCLINLDLSAQHVFVWVASHVCQWWNAVAGNICWEYCLITDASPKPYITSVFPQSSSPVLLIILSSHCIQA